MLLHRGANPERARRVLAALDWFDCIILLSPGAVKPVVLNHLINLQAHRTHWVGLRELVLVVYEKGYLVSHTQRLAERRRYPVREGSIPNRIE